MAECSNDDNFRDVHIKQGYAVFIVNIEKYGNSTFKEREGAREDINIQSVFVPLGFEWINNTAYWHDSIPVCRWDHRKTEGVKKEDKNDCCLRCKIEAKDHSNMKCFVLVISSHGRELSGQETEIFFSDGGSVSVTEIIKALSDENCPSLKGKPRIIILQACRSNFEDKEIVRKMQDHGVYVNEASAGPSTSGSETSSGADGEASAQGDPIVDYTFQQAALRNMPNNFMLVYPSVSGQQSKRDINQGSWLIQGFVKIYEENYKQKPMNFFHLLTRVSGYIAREKESTVHKRKSTVPKRKEGTDNFERDDDRNKIVDEEKSGMKSAVISYHRILEPLVFYPKTKEILLDQPVSFDFGKKKKKDKEQDLTKLLEKLNAQQ